MLSFVGIPCASGQVLVSPATFLHSPANHAQQHTHLRNPETVAQIADALDVSVDHLLGRDAIDRSHEIRSAPLSYYLRDLVTIADTLNLKVCSNGCFIDPHAPEVSDLEMLEYEIDCRTHSALVDFFDSWARFRGLLEKGDFLFDDYSVLVNNKFAGYADIINERDIFIKKRHKK